MKITDDNFTDDYLQITKLSAGLVISIKNGKKVNSLIMNPDKVDELVKCLRKLSR